MEVASLTCPVCGHTLLISNPVEGKLLFCGCGELLKLTRGEPRGKPQGEFWSGFAWGGFIVSMLWLFGAPAIVSAYVKK